MTSESPRFALGRVLITPAAQEAFGDDQAPGQYLVRHIEGDWGELSPDDWQLNDLSVTEGGRILSAYQLSNGEKIWIITESDRSATTILKPSDY